MDVEEVKGAINEYNGVSVIDVNVLKSEPAVSAGENYCSEIWRVKLQIVLSSGEAVLTNAIVKCLPKNEAHKQFIVDAGAFWNEIYMYSTVLKNLDMLLEENKCVQNKIWCNIIGHRNQEVVILDDLKDKGFHTVDRRQMLDWDHAILSIKSLAKYHAMTRVLLKRGLVRRDKFLDYYFFRTEEGIKMNLVNAMQNFSDAIRTEWSHQWVDIADRLSTESNKIVKKIMTLGVFDGSRFNVINHGDCWTNNMMFKNDKDGKPMEIKFIDFQIAHCNSFAWDLTYLIFNSIQGEIRRGRYDEILQAYHTTLVEILASFDFPTEQLPSLKHVREEMERLRYFGLLLIASVHAATFADTSEGVDIEKALEKRGKTDQDRKAGINLKMYSSPKFRKNVEEDLVKCVADGLL